jgi:hypothetical protein
MTAYLPPADPRPVTNVPAAAAHPVEPPPSEDPIYVKVAEILLAGYAIDRAAKAIAALLGLGLQPVLAALGLAKRSASRPNARLAQHLIEPGTRQYEIVTRTRNDDLYFRAAYVVRAARRIQTRVDGDGKSLREAIAEERPNYVAHLTARRRRLDVAARVATAEVMFGPLLGWYRNPLLDSDADCIAADGHNFYAEQIPVIGYPGSVHPNCGCTPGPPHEDAGLVDDAVASLVRTRATVPTIAVPVPGRRRQTG